MNLQTLLTGWDFMRFLRLGAGGFMAVNAFETHDSAVGFFAAFFLFQAVTNTGCCGTGACDTPRTQAKSFKTEDVSFEEIKSTK